MQRARTQQIPARPGSAFSRKAPCHSGTQGRARVSMRLVLVLRRGSCWRAMPAARTRRRPVSHRSAGRGAARRAQRGGLPSLSAAAARRGRAGRASAARRSTASSRRLTFSPRTVAARPRPARRHRRASNANPPFAPYRARHLTQALIDRGRARYAANLGRLSEISRRYGVPPSILIAIWGKETELRLDHGQFRSAQLARQPRL